MHVSWAWSVWIWSIISDKTSTCLDGVQNSKRKPTMRPSLRASLPCCLARDYGICLQEACPGSAHQRIGSKQTLVVALPSCQESDGGGDMHEAGTDRHSGSKQTLTLWGLPCPVVRRGNEEKFGLRQRNCTVDNSCSDTGWPEPAARWVMEEEAGRRQQTCTVDT